MIFYTVVQPLLKAGDLLGNLAVPNLGTFSWTNSCTITGGICPWLPPPPPRKQFTSWEVAFQTAIITTQSSIWILRLTWPSDIFPTISPEESNPALSSQMNAEVLYVAELLSQE